MTSNSRVRRPTAAAGLVILLTSTGLLHFAAPASFDMIVPEQLPGAARTWTHLSGVAELLVAALIAVPRTRRFGGLLAALLFVAVFPANVKMVIDWSDPAGLDARSGLRAAAATDSASAGGCTRLPPGRGQERPVTRRTGAAITEQGQPPFARPHAARRPRGLAPRVRGTSVSDRLSRRFPHRAHATLRRRCTVCCRRGPTVTFRPS